MLYSPHLNISERTPKIIKIEIALCAIALLALTGCPDEGGSGGATPDTTAPVITLTGDAEIVVTIGDTFTDPGATVADDDSSYAGTVIPTIRDSDGTEVLAGALTDTPGTYTITYTAPPDAAGNSPIAVTRTVTVRFANLIDRDGDLLIDIDTLEELDAMRHNLDGTFYRATAGGTQLLCGADATTACIGYELLGNLDFADGTSYASGTVNANWRPTGGTPDSATNAGWEPIGDCNTDTDGNGIGCRDSDDDPFTATFEGNGFTITNLYARNVESDGAGMGLFGINSGAIEGIGTVDANIYGGAGVDCIGGLVGQNTSTGTITASYSIGGSVDGGDGDDDIGGLIGHNDGTVTASYATGNVDGGAGMVDFVGGLVGENIGAITASYATGNVDGGAGGSGLIGVHLPGGTITASYATGNVDGGAGASLAGGGNGTITASYGFGTETGETAGVTRSDDATGSSSDAPAPPLPVDAACDIVVANSSTIPANRWDATQWDFGTDMQRPLVRHNGALVPGQPIADADRGC